jgi:transposase
VEVLTAVCPATGRAEGLVAEQLNAGVTRLFLEQLSTTIPAGVHTLLRLPPHSPELNPVERLWLYLRKHHWSNREYGGIAEMEEAAVSGWRAVCLQPEQVKSICRCHYAEVGS